MSPGTDYTGVSVSFFCHDGNGNLLLAKRSEKCRDENNRWECGGGKLEFGEHPRQGVLREVKEEYGVDGVIERELQALSLKREHNGVATHWVTFPFVVRVPRAKVLNGDPEYISELAWHPFHELPQPLHTGMQMVIAEVGPHIVEILQATV